MRPIVSGRRCGGGAANEVSRRRGVEKRLTAAAFCEVGDMAGELKAAGCSDILRKDELKV